MSFSAGLAARGLAVLAFCCSALCLLVVCFVTFALALVVGFDFVDLFFAGGLFSEWGGVGSFGAMISLSDSSSKASNITGACVRIDIVGTDHVPCLIVMECLLVSMRQNNPMVG